MAMGLMALGRCGELWRRVRVMPLGCFDYVGEMILVPSADGFDVKR